MEEKKTLCVCTDVLYTHTHIHTLMTSPKPPLPMNSSSSNSVSSRDLPMRDGFNGELSKMESLHLKCIDSFLNGLLAGCRENREGWGGVRGRGEGTVEEEGERKNKREEKKEDRKVSRRILGWEGGRGEEVEGREGDNRGRRTLPPLIDERREREREKGGDGGR